MSTYQIEVQSGDLLEAHDVDLLERAAALTLEREQAPQSASVTVRLSDGDALRQLNRTYRDTDSETDVLSFEINEMLPDGSLYLGDVVIATDVAREQAHVGGHAFVAELALLVIHGILHLLGHDHAREEQKAAMWARQSELLATLGLSATPTES